MTKAARDIWHAGEKQIHRALDVEDRMQARGEVVVRDGMPDQHRLFFEKLRFIVLSVTDQKGRVWPILRTGDPGFVLSPNAKELVISSEPLLGEPEDLCLAPGNKISVLGIELETRRRNRMNGTLREADPGQLRIDVDQSYGNCPRYIHLRQRIARQSVQPVGYTQSRALSSMDQDQIQRADALFIASRALELNDDRRAGLDVNHRGGLPGFVRIVNEQTLIIPDYDGNKFFNTFGNILRDARAGLLFPDFASGDLLTLIGKATVILNDEQGLSRYGSKRYLCFKSELVRRKVSAFPLRYALAEPAVSPELPKGCI